MRSTDGVIWVSMRYGTSPFSRGYEISPCCWNFSLLGCGLIFGVLDLGLRVNLVEMVMGAWGPCSCLCAVVLVSGCALAICLFRTFSFDLVLLCGRLCCFLFRACLMLSWVSHNLPNLLSSFACGLQVEGCRTGVCAVPCVLLFCCSCFLANRIWAPLGDS